MHLTEKVAIVTGGSRGLGRAICEKFAELGAKVVVNYTSSPDKAEETVELIKKLGSDGLAIKCNVANEDEVNNLFEKTVEHFGTIDILVNNAGITSDTLMMRMTADQFQQVIDVNLTGTFLCTKKAISIMAKKRYGKIINISSVVGFTGNAGQVNYSASKSGVIGLTKSSALEYAGRGIRVNAVAPGFIESDMTSALNEKQTEEIQKHIALKSMGQPADVANAVAFLADSTSDYITGETIHVNGGLYMN